MPGTQHDAHPIEKVVAPPEKVAELAVQDVARHEEQLVKLILFHDDRALRLLAAYVPVIVALVAAAVGLNQSDRLTIYTGFFIGGTAASFFVGCLCAYAAAWTVPIFLPGRKPQFWSWALEHEIDLRSTAQAYVGQSIQVIAHNERQCNRASLHLKKAYQCGIAALFVGAAIDWVIYWSR
jgi:hypothetical protein